jgi:recombinational DNA repair ATPase RecF
MKLLSIRLHPFGGTANRTCTFHDCINVLEGPNEFGKSTLSKALWHALFTPTNLPPKTLLKAIGDFYPKPGGDHARVALEFEANGHKWTLHKTWGAGAASSLQAEGAAGIADPGEVQKQLNALLHRNEATWQQVMFTSQAQLAATMERLQANSKNIDDVQSLLAGPASIPGDIPPDKLASALEARIAQHFSQWDQNINGPKDGRGIDQQWKQKVGPQLQAYYEMETVRRELNDVIRHEELVDTINAKILHLVGEMSADDEFIRSGRGLRDGLGKRDGLEAKCELLANELNLLKDIMTAWPGAAQVIQGKQTEFAGVTKDLESLEAELRNAKKRSQADQLRAAHGRLTQAKAEWKQAADHLTESKSVPPELLAELKRLEPEIEKLRIQIAAQKLTAKLESTTPLSVTVQRGTATPESITLSPSVLWENQAEGIFRLEYQDLKFSVESGTGDVNALFTQLETARQRQSEILNTLGHESLAAALLADTTRQKLITEESNKKDLYHAALQGRSQDEWAADMAALADLPETRSVDVLEVEKTARLGRKAALDHEIRQEQEKIAKWTKDHTDLESLTNKYINKSAEANQAKQELAGLPALPDGFASIPAYLDLLRSKESVRDQHDEALKNLKIEQGRLTGAAPDTTAEELSADLEIKQRAFERQQSEGQALLRIKSRLQTVIAERGIDDPMQGLTAAVSTYFSNLTGGRYQEVTMNGTAPTQVGGALTLETTLLSQGTLGSLALATRLALSELYLKDMGGFFLLDDPFTDMDATRRAAAVEAIGSFSQKHQVLFFTCHPEHAGELQDLAGARSLLVA